jgi:hypothetical protein
MRGEKEQYSTTSLVTNVVRSIGLFFVKNLRISHKGPSRWNIVTCQRFCTRMARTQKSHCTHINATLNCAPQQCLYIDFCINVMEYKLILRLTAF